MADKGEDGSEIIPKARIILEILRATKLICGWKWVEMASKIQQLRSTFGANSEQTNYHKVMKVMSLDSNHFGLRLFSFFKLEREE